MDDKDIFPQEFLPNLPGASSYDRWRRDNSGRTGDYTKWVQFRDDVLAGNRPNPPQMATKNGRFLVAAAKLHMSVTDVGSSPPPIPPPPTGVLGVDRANMRATGGTIAREDPCTASDPFTGLWGAGDWHLSQDGSSYTTRISQFASGGDPHSRADGSPSSGGYRRLSLNQGDVTSVNSGNNYGNRCDLSRNWWQAGTNPGGLANPGENGPGQTAGTFALGLQDQRQIFFFGIRFPSSYPMNQGNWNQIFEFKQTQPHIPDINTGIGTRNLDHPSNGWVTVEVQIFNGLLQLHTWWVPRASMPAPIPNQWIRFAADIRFSQYMSDAQAQNPGANGAAGGVPAQYGGYIDLYCDYDNAGNWNATNKKISYVGATLQYARVAQNGIPAGGSIPDDFIIGPYRNPVYTGNTYAEFSNIQVMR